MKSTRFPRLLFIAAALMVAANCSDRASLGVAPGPRPVANDLGGIPANLPGLLSCTPMPYDSQAQTIGPDGGTLVVGAYTLVVPPGALDTAVTITGVAPSDTVNVVRFSPDGLHFGVKASLTMSYANCSLLGSLVPREVAQVSDSLAVLGVLPSVDDVLNQVVTGQIRHFSDYAVAW